MLAFSSKCCSEKLSFRFFLGCILFGETVCVLIATRGSGLEGLIWTPMAGCGSAFTGRGAVEIRNISGAFSLPLLVCNQGPSAQKAGKS